MWTEIAAAGGFIGLTGVTMRFLNSKIDKKVDKDTCDIHVEAFQKAANDTGEIKITLGRMDERLESIEKAVNKRS